MIHLRSKANPSCWVSFNRALDITPLDFHLYDFKIGDRVFLEYSNEFQQTFDAARTWARLGA